MSHRARVAGAFAGFRGAVSLAIALSVPTTLANGDPSPGRADIVFITAGVILLALLVQGPLLPLVLRWANLPDDETAEAQLQLVEQESPAPRSPHSPSSPTNTASATNANDSPATTPNTSRSSKRTAHRHQRRETAKPRHSKRWSTALTRSGRARAGHPSSSPSRTR